MGDKKGPGLCLHLGEALATRLDEYCRQHFPNKSEFIRQAVTAHLDSKEGGQPSTAKSKAKLPKRRA
jgi:metal-responsive CopG/Arc/MetJ family transcriptional regulator